MEKLSDKPPNRRHIAINLPRSFARYLNDKGQPANNFNPIKSSASILPYESRGRKSSNN